MLLKEEIEKREERKADLLGGTATLALYLGKMKPGRNPAAG